MLHGVEFGPYSLKRMQLQRSKPRVGLNQKPYKPVKTEYRMFIFRISRAFIFSQILVTYAGLGVEDSALQYEDTQSNFIG
jgi:hypothetical protein